MEEVESKLQINEELNDRWITTGMLMKTEIV